jgi:seryl-tRNA synthetase
VLDIRTIRDEPDRVKQALATRGVLAENIDHVLELDKRRRDLQRTIDTLRAQMKKLGADVAKMSDAEARDRLLGFLKDHSDEVARHEKKARETAEELRARLLVLPNLPHPDLPVGDESANVELRAHGAVPSFAFEARDHLAIGELLGIIDMESGAKVSGSRFTFLKGAAVQLWFAVKQFAMDKLIAAGHTPVMPPVLVRREAMEGTGFFPAAEDQIYQLEKDELFLVGTSEVPLAAMHMEEMLDASALPLRYVAHSACFRREAGAAGKDTRGIFRNHQFEKIEMFVFARPEDSWEEHDRLVALEEEIVRALGLPYRAMLLSTGDTGAPSAKTIDLECWFPGQGRFRETTSCSNTTDYQARRLNVRFKTDSGPVFVHTLNGTVATSSRTIAAILENYQRADGGVDVPEVLRKYTGFDAIEPR